MREPRIAPRVADARSQVRPNCDFPTGLGATNGGSAGVGRPEPVVSAREANPVVDGIESDAGLCRRPVRALFKGRRIEMFDNPAGLPLSPGQRIIVEVERGFDLGTVLDLPRTCEECPEERRRDRRRFHVLRAATTEESARHGELRREDEESLALVKKRVERFQLPMHVVDAEHQFDGNRVTFYFTADHRVDFRELVRDLAEIFRTRIELRQIGTREAARRLGGVGPCGRELCCCSFLWDFERVTLQMAREQNLAINPARLSGICGRLLCCLAYEEGGRPAALSPS